MNTTMNVLSFAMLVVWRIVKYSAIGVWFFLGVFFSLFFAMLGGSAAHDDHQVPLEHTKGGINVP